MWLLILTEISVKLHPQGCGYLCVHTQGIVRVECFLLGSEDLFPISYVLTSLSPVSEVPNKCPELNRCDVQHARMYVLNSLSVQCEDLCPEQCPVM